MTFYSSRLFLDYNYWIFYCNNFIALATTILLLLLVWFKLFAYFGLFLIFVESGYFIVFTYYFEDWDFKYLVFYYIRFWSWDSTKMGRFKLEDKELFSLFMNFDSYFLEPIAYELFLFVLFLSMLLLVLILLPFYDFEDLLKILSLARCIELNKLV